jgi:hypothetical protein
MGYNDSLLDEEPVWDLVFQCSYFLVQHLVRGISTCYCKRSGLEHCIRGADKTLNILIDMDRISKCCFVLVTGIDRLPFISLAPIPSASLVHLAKRL